MATKNNAKMAVKSINNVTESLLAKFDFRKTDEGSRFTVGKDGVRRFEQFKSVIVSPLTPTGEFVSVGGRNGDYYDRIAALNASLAFAVGNYVAVSPLIHKYQSHNPNRVNGAWGWIHISAIKNLPANGSREVVITMDLEGKAVYAQLPTRMEVTKTKDGKDVSFKVVDVKTPWLTVNLKGSGERAQISNAPVNAKLGISLGSIKHDYVKCLAEGKTLNIQTTMDISSMFGMMDRVHRKALWIHGLLTSGKNAEEIRKVMYEQDLAFNEARRVERRITAVQENAPQLIKTAPKSICVDGKDVKIADVPAGQYKVTKAGKTVAPFSTINANANGYNALLQYAIDGYELATVRVFTK